MKTISIDKVTLNIGVGEAGDKLNKAVKLLDSITECKSIQTKSKKRIPTWNIRPGLPIAAKVTLRREKAHKMAKRLFSAKGNILPAKKFDNHGNVSFGISEYLDIPDTKYDSEVGIIGLEAAITLKRPGYRVKQRMLKTTKVGKKQRITKEEAIEYFKKEYNLEVTQ
ncbi:MAG: 50S ribosomal protein L5 [Nanoarchaeota archaeon]